jgi:putative membrane protein
VLHPCQADLGGPLSPQGLLFDQAATVLEAGPRRRLRIDGRVHAGLPTIAMKRLTIILWIAGIVLVAVLIARSDARGVAAAIAGAGWGVTLVVAARVAAVAGAGLGWHALFPDGLRPRLSVCVLIRFIREAVNTLLPFAAIGGELLGGRLLTFFGVGGATAGASIIVDLMVQAGTQFVFALIGLAVLVALGGDATMVRAVAVGLALAVPVLAGFYLAQRRGGHRLAQAVLARLAGGRQWRAFAAVDTLFERLRAFYADRAALVRGTLVHLAIWFVGVLEVWIALAFMGYPVTYAEALVIESLVQAVRSAAFAVPGALGVQEGGLIALCALFGVPAETALALSLIKRVADLVVGLPGLLAWQVLEGRRFVRRHDLAPKAPDPLP